MDDHRPRAAAGHARRSRHDAVRRQPLATGVRTCGGDGTTGAVSRRRAAVLTCLPHMDPSIPFPSLARDLEQLAARGIAPEEAARQLGQLRSPPPALDLDRPCTPGDGIVRIDPAERARLGAVHDAAAARGELCAFVPASGAASRMFRDLLACRNDARECSRAEVEAAAAAGRAEARALLAFIAGLDRFAFRGPLADALAARGQSLAALATDGPWRPLLAALLDADGLDYASQPKGLIPFHAGPGAARTAFEEHLAEAAQLYRDAGGAARIHVTASPDHLDRFHAVLERFRASAGRNAARFAVEFSVQAPSTDTLAIDSDGEPFRDAAGALVFRPAGHGALLGNLAHAPTPVVMIKNIDNVAAAPWRAPTLEWTRTIVGLACELRLRGRALERRLTDERDSAALREAREFVQKMGTAIGTTADHAAGHGGRIALREALARPLRVCGMVPNTGEPGGGPFWVRGRDGRVTRQIVESAQVRSGDATQAAVFAAATHFNPVFLACVIDDAGGRRHDLARFVDADAAIVTRRSAGGRDLVALERPGLWNGGMAGWNTVFVEVPLAVFNPVKTVNDLLRREHQPA